MSKNNPHPFCKIGKKLLFPPGTPRISGSVPPIFSRTAEKITVSLPMVFRKEEIEKLNGEARIHFPDAPQASEEGCLLTVTDKGAMIRAATENGLFYGLQILLTEIESSGVHELTLYETPVAPERGLKLYLPPPTERGFAEFKQIVDLAARCKYNFIMLELGGAMEYKSHPEINEGWIAYAMEMNEYPGKTLEVQKRFPWRKNSIHTENGGGKVLSQKQILELAAYCRERYFEVVPEMPSLSHSDYLLTRHRELSERRDDPFPDTCCPFNPEYHKLFFELIDEVAALLNPRRIHIGHDEYYSIGLCPRCQNQKASDLYANDINRICDYLRSKNIRTVMWGEKLLDSHWLNGEPIGGAASPAGPEMEALPATFQAIGKIDPSIEIFHWYWGVDRNLDLEFSGHGMDYCFANFNAPAFKDWHKRIANPHVRGICVSNWGETSLRTLQRNGVLYDLVYGGFLLWNPELGSEDYPELNEWTIRTLYRFGKEQFPPGASLLTVCHTTQTDFHFEYFFDGFVLDEKKYYMGDHIFRSQKSGREYRFPVIFGSNISNADVDSVRKDDPDSIRDSYDLNSQYREAAFETLPVHDGADGKMWYYCRYLNPCPCEELEYLRFSPISESIPEVLLKNFHVDETFIQESGI